MWRWAPRLFWRGRRGTWRHGPSLCVAGVALGDIDAHFAWQAWHLRHWAGFGGAPGSQMTPWTPRLFAWHAWHLVTSIVTLRGRRGTWRHGPSLCVALGDIDAHFAWQAWHLRHWAGFGGALGFRCGTGRRGSFGVADVPLGDIHLHFAWQAWYLATSTLTLRGRRGTYGTGLALTQSFTHHFVTHHLSHTTLSHPLFHTQLSHTLSFTHNFVTTLSHTMFAPSFTHHL